MEANNLLISLRERGFSINVKNSCLQVVPANKLTDELKQTIRQSKVEILCTLYQEEELRRLVKLVSEHNDFRQEDYEEALETALADFDSAMICFTSLARRMI